MRSKPISSPKTAWSTQSRMTWCSCSRVGNASWASKIIENFIESPPGRSVSIGVYRCQSVLGPELLQQRRVLRGALHRCPVVRTLEHDALAPDPRREAVGETDGD